MLLHEGDPCTSDDLCDTGLCEGPEGFQPICQRKCSSGCKTGEICEQLTPGRFTCVMDRGGTCSACNVDSDCPYPADKCITLGTEKVCGRDCAFDQACPTSYHCVNAQGTDGRSKPQQCAPLSGSCLCTAASSGQMIPCELTNGFGTCRGKRTCDGVMGYGACDAKTPGVETCNGLDDDCDGTTDEGLGMTSCGMGICARTVEACVAGQAAMCMPGPAGTEQCNSLDDDCDGTVDDGFDLSSNVNHCGMCNRTCVLDNATARCDAATCKVATCDMGFGNCDAIEGNGCETNTTDTANHCGACNMRCTFPGATPRCVNSACTFTCLPGFQDLDGNAANGCEYACTFQSATDLPDLQFTDANCDGIDGELMNGVFVAPTAAGGNDANPGTRAQPKATIAGALSAAVVQNKRDVYVSAGTFVGQLNVSGAHGRTVAGGYGLPDWRRSLSNTTTLTGANPAVKVTAVDGGTLQLLTVLGSNAGGVGAHAYGAWVHDSANLKLEGLTLASGDATDGADGQAGSTGASGGNGGVGDRGCTDDPEFAPLLCTTCSRPPVGARGASACGELGGAGGVPGWSFNVPAGNGANGSSGSGGAVGGLGLAPQSGSVVPPMFADGANGANGSGGTNGAGASGAGALTATGYVAPLAAAGLSGTNGRGGGGGGAGGGGCSNSLLGVFCFCFSYGSSGGGGGGGGCAGTAGGAGQSGGASIGLLVWNSSVTATNFAVTTGRGGNGGRGGSGGPGGPGGAGQGSNHDTGQQGNSGRGGRGGNGGVGGPSGHGGGGAGGATYGVVRSSGSTFTQNNVSFTLGTPGSAGSSSGNAGQGGSSVQVQAF